MREVVGSNYKIVGVQAGIWILQIWPTEKKIRKRPFTTGKILL